VGKDVDVEVNVFEIGLGDVNLSEMSSNRRRKYYSSLECRADPPTVNMNRSSLPTLDLHLLRSNFGKQTLSVHCQRPLAYRSSVEAGDESKSCEIDFCHRTAMSVQWWPYIC
jgi:hypothetical protein